MNGTLASVPALLGAIKAGVDNMEAADLAVCPPHVFLPMAAEILASSAIQLGAQNAADQENGAYTGEISAPMLAMFGCTMAIIGHSERRLIYGEDDALVAARAAQVLSNGLIPVICVGETLEQRNSDETFAVIGRQLDAVFNSINADQLVKVVIAYEPVWAIGTGQTASAEQAQDVHAFIRKRLATVTPDAEAIRIVYGGSVKPDNAQGLFNMPDIDGGLIGGASLDALSFLAIFRAALSI